MRRREKRRVIGSCGLLRVPHTEQLEIIYCIDRALWNRGYGTQAARAVLAFAFDELQVPLVHGRCARDNIASLRVLEKIGMRPGRPPPTTRTARPEPATTTAPASRARTA